MSQRKVVSSSVETEVEEVRAAVQATGGASYRADSIVIDVDGRKIEMGPPQGGVMRQIALILGRETDANPSILVLWLKALMFVRSIDGEQLEPMANMVIAQKLANRLGALGEDAVMTAYQEYWPMPTKETLNIVKK